MGSFKRSHFFNVRFLPGALHNSLGLGEEVQRISNCQKQSPGGVL